MMKITAPLTINDLHLAKPEEAAQILVSHLVHMAQTTLIQVNVPLINFLNKPMALYTPTTCFIGVMRHDGVHGAIVWALSFGQETIWLSYRDGQYGCHYTEPRNLMLPAVVVDRRGAPPLQTPMVLHTNDVETLYGHLEDTPRIDRDSLCCVMQRVSEGYTVERYELVAYQDVLTVTVVLANNGGRFDFRLNLSV